MFFDFLILGIQQKVIEKMLCLTLQMNKVFYW